MANNSNRNSRRNPNSSSNNRRSSRNSAARHTPQDQIVGSSLTNQPNPAPSGMNRQAQKEQNINASYYSQAQYGGTQRTYRLTKEQRDARRRHALELKRRKKIRRFFSAIIFLILLIGGFILIKNLTSSDMIPEDELDIADLDDDEEEENYDGPPEATILFAGDISTSAAQVAASTRSDNTYDFSEVFSQVAGYIENSDYAVADFETTMVDNLPYGGDPYYNAPIQLAGNLRKLGFRLMSTANTHMINNGIDGVNSTIKYLNAARLKHVGTYSSEEERKANGGAYIRTIHGIKFAFLSYTKGTDSVYLPDGCEYALNTMYTDYADYWSELRESQIRSDVAEAKDAGAEVVIAMVHWGSEYGRSVTALQEEAADLLMSAGVDVIIGTHSHLVNEMGYQDYEQLDGTKKHCFVAYGIGDFYTDPEKEYACTSLLLNLTFKKDRYDVISIEASYIPIYMYVTSNGGKKSYQVLDTYSTLAKLYEIDELSSTEATLFNHLLDSIDTLHYYAGEDLDVGPPVEISASVSEAIASGPYSDDYIQSKKNEERFAEKEAAASAAALAPSPSPTPAQEQPS